MHDFVGWLSIVVELALLALELAPYRPELNREEGFRHGVVM
jgi:hypothetical protein